MRPKSRKWTKSECVVLVRVARDGGEIWALAKQVGQLFKWHACPTSAISFAPVACPVSWYRTKDVRGLWREALL